ncbi:MAG: aspartate aminotransferase family protein [Halodesulfurarchaeum sp.]
MTANRSGSRYNHELATSVFPGGVSHNVRYHEPHPIYVDSAAGATITDVDGNEYVDYWMNHQASLLGHAHPDVVEAVREQALDGFHYGTPNEVALRFARRILQAFPSAQRLRFTSSGTEATMYAVRLARATTGKDHILKAQGGWHGGNSDLSAAVHAPYHTPTTAGLPPGVEEHVHAFALNDEERVLELLEGHDVGAVIVEPMLLAAGGVECDKEFLAMLREEADDRDFVLIFDEVVTGFRFSPGSYQARVGIEPDLTTFGKVAGGGFPIGGLVGSASLFERARPDSAVETPILAGGGTFTMNPMTATAGLATLQVIDTEPVYEYTESRGEYVRQEFTSMFEEMNVDGTVLGNSSLFCPHLAPTGPLDHAGQVETGTDRDALREFHHSLIDRGHYHLPGHMGSISYVTTDEQIEDLLETSRAVLAELKKAGTI